MDHGTEHVARSASRNEHPGPAPLIEYEDTRAEVTLSRLVLWASLALTLAIVCVDVTYVVLY